MRFIVLGGGCYGTFYARQLVRARDAGVLEVDEVVIVDRDPHSQARRDLEPGTGLVFAIAEWDRFLDEFLPTVPRDATDQFVPPPFTPHLALGWLLRRLRAERPHLRWELEPFRRFPGTPFERQAHGGPLVVSHADWICPVHCIEPETCPKTRGPRHWDMDRTARDLAAELEHHGQPVHQVHLFQCLHLAFGVGTFPVAAVTGARSAMYDAASTTRTGTVRFLVGTISRCHGALHLLTGRHGTNPVS